MFMLEAARKRKQWGVGTGIQVFTEDRTGAAKTNKKY